MTFSLSTRSLGRLEGVHPAMAGTVKMAIKRTKIDFGVTCGLRTVDEQKRLVASGRSQTMNSKHIPQADGMSHAVDLVAYDGPSPVWELNMYDDICDAMAAAAREVGCNIKWGAAWSEGSITGYAGSAEDAMNAYIDLRRGQGRRPFIDAPHFELMV